MSAIQAGSPRKLRREKSRAGLLAWLVILGGVFQAAPSGAYFLDLGGGVRPTGMGEAFVAVADDANAMQYNAAGLSQLDRLEVAGMYANLYSGLNIRLYNQGTDQMGYNLLAAAVPVKELQGTLGLTWKKLNTDFYQENTLQFGYGRQVWAWPGKDGAVAVDAGVNGKYLQWQLAANAFTANPDNYPFAELQRHGFSADAGLLARFYSRFRIGLSAENIVPANVGLTTTEYVPTVYRLGAGYWLPWQSTLVDACCVSLEVDERLQAANYKAGAEAWLFHRAIGVRAGANSDNLSCGLSYRYAWDPSLLDLQVDYAFTYPWHISDSLGSHWVGLTIGWDWLNPRENERNQELARKTQSALRGKTLALEAAQASVQTLAAAQAAVKTAGVQALGLVVNAEAKIGDAAETAALAAEVAQTAADEAKSTTITGMAAEAAGAAAAAAAAARQIQALLQDVRVQAAQQALPAAAAAPTAETPPLLEKYSDRIVVGIETKVITDFGSIHDLELGLRNLAAALQKAAELKVQWRWLSPPELLLYLHQGELDGVVAYETELGKYRGANRLRPVLTARKNGRTDQPCCLLVLAGSPLTTLAQARGKRLGYSNGLVAGRIDQLFLGGQGAPGPPFFGSMAKQKNARDSLGALQMEAVDVVAEYAYILDVARFLPGMNVRVLAESAPVPNAVLWLRTSQHPQKNSALQKMTAALLEIHREPAAAPLLQLFQIERLVKVHEKE